MSDGDATCIDLPRLQRTLVHLQVRTLIPNGNYLRGAALLGFNHLKRLKNEWPLVFEYPSAIDRTVRAVMELTSGLRRLRRSRSRPSISLLRRRKPTAISSSSCGTATTLRANRGVAR